MTLQLLDEVVVSTIITKGLQRSPHAPGHGNVLLRKFGEGVSLDIVNGKLGDKVAFCRVSFQLLDLALEVEHWRYPFVGCAPLCAGGVDRLAPALTTTGFGSRSAGLLSQIDFVQEFILFAVIRSAVMRVCSVFSCVSPTHCFSQLMVPSSGSRAFALDD